MKTRLGFDGVVRRGVIGACEAMVGGEEIVAVGDVLLIFKNIK